MLIIEHKDLLESLSCLATIIGIPIAIFAFLYEKRKDRLQREMETYIQANQRYIEYLALCLEHPEFDCAEFMLDDKEAAAARLSVGKLTMFTMLISLLEEGYILYRNHRGEIRKKQWQGWDDYMADWAKREDFRKAWSLLAPQFDTDFIAHIQKHINRAASSATAPAPSGNPPAASWMNLWKKNI